MLSHGLLSRKFPYTCAWFANVDLSLSVGSAIDLLYRLLVSSVVELASAVADLIRRRLRLRAFRRLSIGCLFPFLPLLSLGTASG